MSLLLPSAVAQADDGDEDHNEGEDSTYGQKGTLEAGGDVSANWAGDVFVLDLGPSIGYFFLDRLELTLDVDFIYTRVDDEDTGEVNTTKAMSLVLEPSYHHPVSKQLQLLGGLGVGTGWNGDDWDFELIPRVGLNILTARSNVITPSIEFPILIGEAFGDDGEVGTQWGILFEIGITGTW
ncbi:MAG: hypothetical protein SFX73_18375 [Kofleriaceae bacterium]|nr:hypothetical protein [Kofleriaceae bacterium]